MKVALQPAGNPEAQRHYRDTMDQPVPMSRIRPHVSPEARRDLDRIYPDGQAFVWGVTPGSRGQNRSKWQRLSQGDLVLFASEGRLFSSAEVTYKLHSEELAESLWGKDAAGNTWECVYFLSKPEARDIPQKS